MSKDAANDVVAQMSKRLARERASRGISKKKLAKLADVDRSTVKAIEDPDDNPAILDLLRYGIALKLDVGRIVSEFLVPHLRANGAKDKTSAKPKAKAESGAKPKVKTQAKAVVKPKAKTKSKPAAKPKAAVKPKAVAKRKVVAKPKAAAKPKTVTKPKARAKSKPARTQPSVAVPATALVSAWTSTPSPAPEVTGSSPESSDQDTSRNESTTA